MKSSQEKPKTSGQKSLNSNTLREQQPLIHSEYENQSPIAYSDNELSEIGGFSNGGQMNAAEILKQTYQPDNVIEEEYSLNGVPVQTLNYAGGPEDS